MTKNLNPLPNSDDEYFEGAEKYVNSPSAFTPIEIPVCKTHSKDKWKKHVGYTDNGDGTASCKKCGWGFRLPGYMRILKERVVDLRDGQF